MRENACELSWVDRSVLSCSELAKSRKQKLTETCRSVAENVRVEAVRVDHVSREPISSENGRSERNNEVE